MSKNATEILNPLPGGMRFTANPKHFIKLGIAQMVGDKLSFHSEHQNRLIIYREMSYWNGSDNPTKMHRPGEVRS